MYHRRYHIEVRTVKRTRSCLEIACIEELIGHRIWASRASDLAFVVCPRPSYLVTEITNRAAGGRYRILASLPCDTKYGKSNVKSVVLALLFATSEVYDDNGHQAMNNYIDRSEYSRKREHERNVNAE